jgi:hypothetical protein
MDSSISGKINNPKRNLSNVLWLLIAFSSFIQFGRAVLPVHLFSQGLSYLQIIFGSSLVILGQLIVMSLIGFKKRNYSSKIVYITAIILYIVFFILSGSKIFFSGQYYIGSILSGIGSTLFYLFFSIQYFSNKSSGVYTQSAIFFNVLAGVSVIVPLVAGFIGSFSFAYVLIYTIVLFIITLIVILFQDKKQFSFSIQESFIKAKGAKGIIILDGIFDSLSWGIISIVTLKLIHEPLLFGGFFSYLTLLAIVSNYFIGKIGDKNKNGRKLVAVVSFLMFLAILPLGFFTKNIIVWAIASGIFGILSTIFSAIVLGITLEMAEDKVLMFPAREVLINSGRLIGLFWAVICLYFELATYLIFMLPAVAVLLLGIRVYSKTKPIPSQTILE